MSEQTLRPERLQMHRIEFDEKAYRESLSSRPELVRTTLDSLGIRVPGELSDTAKEERLKINLEILREYLKPIGFTDE